MSQQQQQPHQISSTVRYFGSEIADYDATVQRFNYPSQPFRGEIRDKGNVFVFKTPPCESAEVAWSLILTVLAIVDQQAFANAMVNRL